MCTPLTIVSAGAKTKFLSFTNRAECNHDGDHAELARSPYAARHSLMASQDGPFVEQGSRLTNTGDLQSIELSEEPPDEPHVVVLRHEGCGVADEAKSCVGLLGSLGVDVRACG